MAEIYSKYIEKELAEFNLGLEKSLCPSVFEFNNILKYISNTKGKQIRPVIGILTAKMLGGFSEKQNIFLQTIELIHNATLFHDDVIDEAKVRRNSPSLNEKFSNKTAVLVGDYFLSSAIKNMTLIKEDAVNDLLSDFMKKICEGEIEQNLSLNKISPLEKYLEKTKYKTALLFSLTTAGTGMLSKKTEQTENLKLFGEYTGMIFQLADDINNFKDYKNKPVLNDLKSGVITAPVIFLAQEYPETEALLQNKNYDEILNLLKKSDSMEKSQKLVETYREKAKELAKSFPDNEFKNLLLNLLSELGR